MRAASLGGVLVTAQDLVVADDDGVLVLGPDRRDQVLEAAAAIVATEQRQDERGILHIDETRSRRPQQAYRREPQTRVADESRSAEAQLI